MKADTFGHTESPRADVAMFDMDFSEGASWFYEQNTVAFPAPIGGKSKVACNWYDFIQDDLSPISQERCLKGSQSQDIIQSIV